MDTDVSAAIAALRAYRTDEVYQAAQTLVGLGESAVEPLLEALIREPSPTDWHRYGAVLRKIGPAASTPVAAALSAVRSDEERRRLAWAFVGLGGSGSGGGTGAASGEPLSHHPDPAVREVARSKPFRKPSPDSYGAIWDLSDEPGSDPGHPVPLLECWTAWMAVPGDDPAEVAEALGLAWARPVTWDTGAYVVDGDAHERGNPVDHRAFSRVLLTPPVSGWIVVAGRWCDPWDPERHEDVLSTCLRLSSERGRAQAFFHGAQGDGESWLLCADGAVVRYWDSDNALPSRGEPTAIERRAVAEAGLPDGWEDDDEASWDFALACPAPRVAGEHSVDPGSFGPGTPPGGTPLLAFTPYAALHGTPQWDFDD